MFERFSEQARRVVVLAEEEARRLGHHRIGTEHLLLGLLATRESSAARTLTGAGATLETARHKVAEAVANEPEDHQRGSGLTLTPRASRALERAARFSRQRRHAHVETVHVLLGVLDVEGTAGQVLRGLGVDIASLEDAVGAAVEEHEPAAPQVAPAPSERPPPRCATCGADLRAALAHRVVCATSDASEPRDFFVAYCGVCGSALGAMPT